jgi:hypothetical protein
MSVYNKQKKGFPNIPGFTKRVKCSVCGKLIPVDNMNQLKCAECGYRGKNQNKVDIDEQ